MITVIRLPSAQATTSWSPTAADFGTVVVAFTPGIEPGEEDLFCQSSDSSLREGGLSAFARKRSEREVPRSAGVPYLCWSSSISSVSRAVS